MNDLALRQDQHNNLKAAASVLRGSASKLYMKFVRGDFTNGSDLEEVRPGTKFAVNVSAIGRGYRRWQDGQVADQRLVALASGETPIARGELGYLDRDEWDHDESNRPIDPWQIVFEIPLREVGGKWREITLAGGSRGMEKAVRDLLDDYLAIADQKAPELVPVIALQVGRYQH